MYVRNYEEVIIVGIFSTEDKAKGAVTRHAKQWVSEYYGNYDAEEFADDVKYRLQYYRIEPLRIDAINEID